MKIATAFPSILFLLSATSGHAFTAFTATNSNIKKATTTPIATTIATTTTSLSSQENAIDEPFNRRGFFVKALGGATLTGIVANGIAVQGPNPYIPPPQSLVGKVVVITGGNTGLGLESGKRLAASGATIILTSRSVTKGARAVQDIKEYVLGQTGLENNNIYTLPLDLCDMESVKNFPELLRNSDAIKNNSSSGIDVLLNNAGVMAVPDLQITKDGYEKTFQSNHLGHFALTGLLLPYLNEGSRVVNVSSMAHLIASKGLDLSNLNGEKEYKKWDAYGRSKLENILFTKELQRRADAAGKRITTVALHPGAVRTDLPRYIIGEDKFISMQDAKPTLVDEIKLLPALYFTKGVDRGASTQIYLSAFQGRDEDIAGKFFFNLKETALGPAAMDEQKAKELWKISEQMSGIEYKF